MKKFAGIFHYLPLTCFILVARHNGFGEESWSNAFLWGGGVALLQSAFFLIFRFQLNPILLGVNLFLWGGALGFAIPSESILKIYGELGESALFVAISLAGIGSTVFARDGFVEVPGGKRSRESWQLLGVVMLCTAVSIYFRGNVVQAGTLPFILMLIARKILRMRAPAKR